MKYWMFLAIFSLLFPAAALPAIAQSATVQSSNGNVSVQPAAGWQGKGEEDTVILISPQDARGKHASLGIKRVDAGDNLRQFLQNSVNSTDGSETTVSEQGGGTDDLPTIKRVYRVAAGMRYTFSAVYRTAHGDLYAEYFSDDPHVYKEYASAAATMIGSATVQEKKESFVGQVLKAIATGIAAGQDARQHSGNGNTADTSQSFVGFWQCTNSTAGYVPSGNDMTVRADGTYSVTDGSGRYHVQGDTIYFDSGPYANFGSATRNARGLLSMRVVVGPPEIDWQFERR